MALYLLISRMYAVSLRWLYKYKLYGNSCCHQIKLIAAVFEYKEKRESNSKCKDSDMYTDLEFYMK